MHLLADLARTELAVRLLTRNARISIAHYESGLPLRRLRDLYRELRHRKPASGQLPAVGCPAIRTRRRQIHASLFATVYEAQGGPRVYQATDGAAAAARSSSTTAASLAGKAWRRHGLAGQPGGAPSSRSTQPGAGISQ
jgi:hypothetical protein